MDKLVVCENGSTCSWGSCYHADPHTYDPDCGLYCSTAGKSTKCVAVEDGSGKWKRKYKALIKTIREMENVKNFCGELCQHYGGCHGLSCKFKPKKEIFE